jgi:DNA-binding PadR family transcriptional regulator
MKRDMDLVREILLECEKQDGTGRPIKVKVEGHSGDEVNYHLVLLKEVGFIEASSVLNTRFGPIVQPIRLTWSGHEFLNAARSSKLWDGAKEFALKTTGTLTLEGLKLAIPHVTKLLMGG